jgi:hypothetical protein
LPPEEEESEEHDAQERLHAYDALPGYKPPPVELMPHQQVATELDITTDCANYETELNQLLTRTVDSCGTIGSRRDAIRLKTDTTMRRAKVPSDGHCGPRTACILLSTAPSNENAQKMRQLVEPHTRPSIPTNPKKAYFWQDPEWLAFGLLTNTRLFNLKPSGEMQLLTDPPAPARTCMIFGGEMRENHEYQHWEPVGKPDVNGCWCFSLERKEA